MTLRAHEIEMVNEIASKVISLLELPAAPLVGEPDVSQSEDDDVASDLAAIAEVSAEGAAATLRDEYEAATELLEQQNEALKDLAAELATLKIAGRTLVEGGDDALRALFRLHPVEIVGDAQRRAYPIAQERLMQLRKLQQHIDRLQGLVR